MQEFSSCLPHSLIALFGLVRARVKAIRDAPQQLPPVVAFGFPSGLLTAPARLLVAAPKLAPVGPVT
jgi:hypothetical protein